MKETSEFSSKILITAGVTYASLYIFERLRSVFWFHFWLADQKLNLIGRLSFEIFSSGIPSSNKSNYFDFNLGEFDFCCTFNVAFFVAIFFESLLQFYFSEHAKEKLRNSVHYTSSKCSQQVENELRETFTRLELGRFSNLILWLAIQSGRRNWVSFILKSNLSCQWSHYRYWR